MVNDLARRARIRINGNGGTETLSFFNILDGVNITWGRKRADEAPSQTSLKFRFVKTDAASFKPQNYMRGRVLFETRLDGKSSNILFFNGIIDSLHYKEIDGIAYVTCAAIQSHKTTDALDTIRQGYPRNTFLNEVEKFAINALGGAPKPTLRKNTASNLRLFNLDDEQPYLSPRKWFEAIVCARPGTHPIWTPDLTELAPSIQLLGGLTWGTTVEAPIDKVIGSREFDIDLSCNAKAINAIRSGKVIVPELNNHALWQFGNVGPALDIETDYGIHDHDLLAAMAHFWQRQKTTPRKLKFRSSEFDTTWANRSIWLPWESDRHGIILAGDSVAAKMEIPAAMSPIGGDLTISSDKSVHELWCVWRDMP